MTGADGEFDLTQPGDAAETGLAPDVAFVRVEYVPPRDAPEYKWAWHVAPDLVVEVASPNQFRPGMAAKVRRYLTDVVRLVWVVWPKYQQVDVWRAAADQPDATLDVGDALDGLDMLPDFSYPLARLFA